MKRCILASAEILQTLGRQRPRNRRDGLRGSLRWAFISVCAWVASLGAHPAAHAAHQLQSRVQTCDYANSVMTQCTTVDGTPAVSGIAAATTDNFVLSGSSNCPAGNRCYSFTGAADGAAAYGGLSGEAQMTIALDGILLPSVPASDPNSPPSYPERASSDSSFQDNLSFSTGSKARFTFTVTVTGQPCTSAVSGGFNCDPTESSTSATIGYLIGSSSQFSAVLGFQLRGSGPFTVSNNFDPANSATFTTNTCSGVCGELVSALIPLTGGALPLQASMSVNTLSGLYDSTKAPKNGFGSSTAVQFQLTKIEVFDANGQPVSAVITSESGSQYPGASGGGTAQLSLSNTSLSFPATALGATSAAQTLTLSNSGSAVLTVSSLTLQGGGAGDFALSQDGCSGRGIAAGASCNVSIAFAPSAAGTRTASLSISSNDPSTPTTIALSGTGSAPLLAVSSAALDFGTVTVGKSSAAQSLTLTNQGDANLTIGAIALGGPNAGEFALNEHCSGTSLAQGATCIVSITFSPSAATAASANVSIVSNSQSGSPTKTTVSGMGQAMHSGGGAVGLAWLLGLLGVTALSRARILKRQIPT